MEIHFTARNSRLKECVRRSSRLNANSKAARVASGEEFLAVSKALQQNHFPAVCSCWIVVLENPSLQHRNLRFFSSLAPQKSVDACVLEGSCSSYETRSTSDVARVSEEPRERRRKGTFCVHQSIKIERWNN